jgi:hypothetical protein
MSSAAKTTRRLGALLALSAVSALQMLGAGAASAAEPQFGIAAFDGSVTDAAGNPLLRAGAHPATFTTALEYNTAPAPGALGPVPVEDTHELVADLPAGFLGATAGLPQCLASELAHSDNALSPKPECASTSQIGLLHIRTDIGETGAVPIVNMVPPPGAPARFGANVAGALVVLDTTAVPGGGYRLRTVTTVPQGLAINGNTLTLWGVPWASGHDSERICRGESIPTYGGPSCNARDEIVGAIGTDPSPPDHVIPTFRNPTSCTNPGEGLQFDLRADSWQHPGAFDEASYRTHQAPGFPEPPANWGEQVGIEGCDQVPFEPTLEVRPSTDKADSPTGLTVDLGLPGDCWEPMPTPEEVEAAICQSDMKDASLTLPKGLTLNPAAASGRAGCSPAGVGVTSAPGSSPVEFDNSPVACPDASKIGSVEIKTPLLDETLQGSIYLAEQSENPFKSLLAMYLVAEVPGVRIKQAGQVTLGADGQLTTSFASAPQMPFSNIHVALFGGQRAALRTPACGTYATTSALAPWAAVDPTTGAVDQARIVHPSSSFQITAGCGGGFDPKLDAGTQNPLAGSFSPFSLRFTREDASQEIAKLEETLPPGLIGAPAGIPYCPDSVLASFPAETILGTGAAQEASPSCPAASLLGTVTVGAGAGANPFYTAAGRAYLAGPYNGAPLSIAVLAPAVAGPFDLGTVLVRNAVDVNPETAQISVASDPFPTVVHGIPLDLRDVRVNLNRPNFTLNPTSCEPRSITSTVTSAQGATAHPGSRYQAANCGRLAFKPRLSLSLKGGTTRSRHPALTAVLRPRLGNANAARIQVALPHSEFLAQDHIRTICTRVQFAAGGGGGEQCPAGSIYGKATAISPLLDYPLSGNVYLRSSDHPLPDMVLALNGPASQPLQVAAVGRIDSIRGGIRTTFATLPDAPLSKVVLSLPGGKKSLLENSTDLCRSTKKARVAIMGQNGKAADFAAPLRVRCGKGGGGKKGTKKERGSGR